MGYIIKYKIWCNTDSKWEYWYLPQTSAAPQTCPYYSLHEVDLSKTAAIKIVDPSAPKKNASGAMIVDTGITFGLLGAQSMTITSHDWCDRTTWYQRSVKVEDEALQDSGDNLTFNSGNPCWVDIDSKKLTYDYGVVPERDGSFSNRSLRRAVVKIDGEPQESGYSVNYVDGKVTFDSPQVGKTITATYYHNNNVERCSEWVLCPPPDSAYLLNYIECQFSKNIQFNTKGIKIEAWAGGIEYGDVPDVYGNFEDESYDAGFGQNKSIYRGPIDFLNICTNRASQIIPAFGGLSQDTLIFPFDYLVNTQVRRSQGTVIVMSLIDDEPYTNAEIATSTFYMQLTPEDQLNDEA